MQGYITDILVPLLAIYYIGYVGASSRGYNTRSLGPSITV
jgi:hypothetical protein